MRRIHPRLNSRLDAGNEIFILDSALTLSQDSTRGRRPDESETRGKRELAHLKKLLWLAVIAVTYVIASGYYTLGEAGVNRFLDRMDEASIKGDAQTQCDLLADDIEVSVHDHSGPGAKTVEGGKDKLCELVKKVSAVQALVPMSMTVRRDNLIVEHGFLHCWTAEISYFEHQSASIPSRGFSLKTVSENHLTLVKTWSGVVIKRLETQARIDDGT
jgi:hypothetical protein